MPLAQRVLRCPRLPLELMRVAPLAHRMVGTAGRSRLFRRWISCLVGHLGLSRRHSGEECCGECEARHDRATTWSVGERAAKKSHRGRMLVPVCASSRPGHATRLTSYRTESDGNSRHLQHRDAARQARTAFTAAGQYKGSQHHTWCLQPGEAWRPHVCRTMHGRNTPVAAQPHHRFTSNFGIPSVRHHK